MEFTIKLSEQSLNEIITILEGKRNELYEKQIYLKNINSNKRSECLEEFILVGDLISQFEDLKTKTHDK